ncbi:hypothetical protein [Nocardioides jishulii]|uniref:Aminoglycoside phosphotransferase domain-containing protein n=1 Tax=Nocardioides jishulii TaxID=2575440 RepID=A0A4U2YIT4_9ACTN|nr:hypothetical protein [Nocardioides jishulii]QCX26655.1 hypothetical protein FCL41_03160 [Nocardioides jishulii]TKI60375.1 hypothetical protein FC770_16390 [Nocardioides jishulii]
MPVNAPAGSAAGEGLEAVVEQLWAPALATGEVVVARHHDPGNGWRTLEGYRAIPSLSRARLLVPDGPRALGARAVGNYRALLPAAAHARRTALTAGAWAGLPLVSQRVLLQARADLGRTPLTPMTLLRDRLGEPDLTATWRVNLNTNRKATLQLLDRRGAPRGLAKFAWEPLSAEGVRREAAALRDLAGQLRVTRVPALRTEEDYYGQPAVVAAPLPPDVRGAGVRRRPPSPVEVHDLFPVVGRSTAATTGTCRALAGRLDSLASAHPGDASVATARALLREALASPSHLPVAARWHGDFVPWNCARDDDGTLWVWDWETSEREAPAGLDSLHWAVGARQEQHGERWEAATVMRALDDATPMLRALGIAPSDRSTVLAVYAAALAERVLAHALGEGGWQEEWMLREQLDAILAAAGRLLRDTVTNP